MTNLQIAKLYLATDSTLTATAIDAAITDGSALTAVTALTQTALLNAAYQAAFGRDADAEGLAYWGDRLDNGLTTTGLVDSLVAGAAAYVAPTAENPLVIGDLTFTAATVGGENDVAVAAAKAAVEASATNINVAEAALLLEPVVDAATEATAATAISTDYVAVTAALTTAADTLTGGKANDTFTAQVLTLNDTDSIVDSSALDSDTFTAEINGNIANTFTTTNVENIEITALGSYTLDMKKMTGVEAFTTKNSAGNLTLNTVESAAMSIAFEGNDTNNVTANYATGALTGTTDALIVNLNTASAVNLDVDSGFESATINVTGASDLDLFATTSAKDVTIAGTGTLDVADGIMTVVDNLTITNTAAVTIGDWTGAKTLTATTNTDGIFGKVAPGSADGRSDDVIVADSSGLTMLLGSGADNVNVSTAGTLTSTSNLIKLGAGSDTLELSAKGAATYIYGEAGDDTVVAGTAGAGLLTSSDLVDGGEGTDTLVLLQGTHSLLAKGIENVTLGADNTANATSVTFTSVDSAVAVSYTNTNATAQAVTVAGLMDTSTFTAAQQVAALTVGMKTGEAGTIDLAIQKGLTGALTVTNVADITATIGAASTLIANDITLDTAATSLTINATGDFDFTDITAITTATNENLATLTVTGTGAIDIEEIDNDYDLTNVTITSSGVASAVNLNSISSGDARDMATFTLSGHAAVGTASASATALDVESLTTGTVTSSGGAVNFGDVVAKDTTNLDGGIGSLTINGKTNAEMGSIDADKIDTLSITSSAGYATVDDITTTTGAGASGAIGTITMTASTEASVGQGAQAIAADTIGTISVNSSTSNAYISETGSITAGGAATSSDFTDGTITLLEANAYQAAEIGAIAADVLTAVRVTSTTTTAEINTITDANTGAAATVGTVAATAYSDAKTGAITADALTSVIVTGSSSNASSTATLGAVTVTSAAKDSVVTKLEATASAAVTLATGAAVTVDSLTTVIATSALSTVVVGDIDNTNADTDGVLGTVTLQAAGKLTVGEIGSASADAFETMGTVSYKGAEIDAGDIIANDTAGINVIMDASDIISNTGTGTDVVVTNTKGDVTLTLKGTGASAEVQAISTLATDTTVNVLLDASAMTGKLGLTGTDHAIVDNNSINTSSTTIVKVGADDSFVDVTASAGTVTVYGNAGADTISVATSGGSGYATSTIYGEAGTDVITAGVGVDTIYGGTGADKFIFATGADSSTTKTDIIMDYAAGEEIQGTNATTLAAAGVDVSTATSGVAGIDDATGAAALFHADDDTFAEHVIAVEAALTAANTASADIGAAAHWQEGNDTYVFISDASAGVTAADVLIKLTGVDSTDAATDILTIANNNFTLA